MATATSEKTKPKFDNILEIEQLYAQYCAAKGDQEVLYQRLQERTIVLKPEEKINEWRRSDGHEDSVFVCLLEDTFPKQFISKQKNAPLVLEILGSPFALLEGADQVVVLDSYPMSSYLVDKGLTTILYRNNWITIRDKENSGSIYSTNLNLLNHLTPIPKFLLVGNNKENGTFLNFIRSAEFLQRVPTKNLFAVPGKSGSYTNQLIKRGWHLCDSANDLI